MKSLIKIPTLVVTLILIFQERSLISEGCSPPMGPPPTIEQVADNAQIIVVGKVLEKYPDFHVGSLQLDGSSTVHTALMHIYCQYKGENVSDIVNITETGYVPGHCISTNPEVGKEYMIMAHRFQGGDLKISHPEIEMSSPEFTRVINVCGMDRKVLPSSENSGVCPPVAKDDCVEAPDYVDYYSEPEGPPAPIQPKPDMESIPGTMEPLETMDHEGTAESEYKPTMMSKEEENGVEGKEDGEAEKAGVSAADNSSYGLTGSMVLILTSSILLCWYQTSR